MRCRARALVGQEEHRLRESVGIGERLAGLAGAEGAGEGFDAGVDDQERDVDSVRSELERRSIGDRPYAERSGRTQSPD